MRFWVLFLNIIFTFLCIGLIHPVYASYTGPELKVPLPGGYSWRVNTAPGGTCGSSCTDGYHAGTGFYSVDFDDGYESRGSEVTVGDGLVDVMAAADGIVIYVPSDASACRQCTIVYDSDGNRECSKSDPGIDCYVIVDHGSGDGHGYETIYRHMAANSIVVHEGDPVVQGQLLGKMGTTGQSTGTHVHFQLKYNGDSSQTNSNIEGVSLDGTPFVNYAYGNYYLSTQSGGSIDGGGSSYSYTADVSSTRHDPDNEDSWHGILQMSLSIDGHTGTFTISKVDGTVFTTSGYIYLYDSTDTTDTLHSTTRVSSSPPSVSVRDNFDAYTASTYPKAYYATFVSDSGGYTVVGPITVSATASLGREEETDDGTLSDEAQSTDDSADTDGDGLSDSEEATLGTDPNDRDTDNDGYSDGFEVTDGTDPTDWDTDDDGVMDGGDRCADTVARNSNDTVDSYGCALSQTDSDSDGLSDYDERYYYDTDPHNTDSDGDGLTDGDEVNIYGTNPRYADTDHDGINDGDDTSGNVVGGSLTAKLLALDGTTQDYLGYSVAVDGDVAVVGAWGDADIYYNAGSAYVFRWDGYEWIEETKLVPSDTYGDDRFGYSVAISGNVIAVGSLYDDSCAPGAGSIYVYRYDGSRWNQEQELKASDCATQDFLGFSVAVDGDRIIAGALLYGRDYSGAAYVFNWNGSTWSQESKLTASDAVASDVFGVAVDIEGDEAVVGSNQANVDSKSDAGATYVFNRTDTTWIQTTKLTASDGSAGDRFGTSVAISGKVIAVGAPYSTYASTSQAGKVYLYQNSGSTWSSNGTLTVSDAATGDYFGYSLSLNGNFMMVGAYGDYVPVYGSAYGYEYDGSRWNEIAHLTTTDASSSYTFYGLSVGVSSDGLGVVGAYGDTDNGSSAGALYTYDLTDSDNLADPDSDGDGILYQYDLCADTAPVDSSDTINSDGCALSQIDSDGDELSDYYENFYGTDPNNPDSDGDTLSDAEEVMMGESLASFTGSTNNSLGSAVAVDDGVALVGAYGDNQNGALAGAAYVYRWSGSSWNYEAKLTASDPHAIDFLGRSVAIDGDLAVVGAIWADGNVTDSGAAYVYRYNGSTWSQEAKLIASDGSTSYDYFGYSVAVHGDMILVGSIYGLGSGAHSGAVYVYRYDGSSWNQEDKLIAEDDSTSTGYFGRSLSIDGNNLIVGAMNDYWNGGAAYVYHYNGRIWDYQAKLTPADGGVSGNSASISGDVAIVAATSSSASVAGKVYVYRRTDSVWNEEATLTASDQVNQSFGESVGINRNTILVGSPHWNNDGEIDDGDEAYLFYWDGAAWTQTTVLNSGDAGGADSFGNAVALNGSTALVGALTDDENGVDSGSVFFFDATPPMNPTLSDTDGDGLPDATEVYLGTDPNNADTDGDGIADNVDSDPLIAIDSDGDGIPDGSDLCPETTTLPDDYVYDENGCVVLESDVDNDGVGDSRDICSSTSPVDSNDTVNADGCSLSQIDSDGDSLSDYQELYVYGSSLSDTDSDDDGLTDYDEAIVYGTDPNNADTDGDGISDYVEIGSKSSTKILASDGAAYDDFGHTVAMDGDLLVVGAPVNNYGAAYVYRWNGTAWNQEAKLTASDGSANDHFGYSVAISGNVIVVGSIYNNIWGAAYVYRYNGSSWIQETKFQVTMSGGGYFGSSVAVKGNVAVVGAGFDMTGGSYTGSAYVYRYSGSSWNQETKLLASDGANYDYYGYFGVAVSEDVIIVGSYGADDGEIVNSGAAYVYRRISSVWIEEKKLKPTSPKTQGYFGGAISLGDDETVIIGSTNGDAASVYRYDGSDWKEEPIPMPTDDPTGAQDFGVSVSIQGDLALVGAYANYLGTSSGAVYLYRFNGSSWNEEEKLTARDGEARDYFGISVALSENNAVIGANADDDQGINSGSVYIYQNLYVSNTTNPLLADTDSDGYLDGIDPNPLVAEDTDGDGVYDGYEVSEGSNPNDSSSTPCIPPTSGTDWTITHNCTFFNSKTWSGNLYVQSSAVMTIPSGLSLDMDFTQKKLVVSSGSGVLIQNGGSLR